MNCEALLNPMVGLLEGVSLFELVGESGLDPESEQTVLHPSEVELGETAQEVMKRVDDLCPARVV